MSESVPPPPPPAAREERVHALDNLRAVAMLLGIVLHAALSFMTLPIPWVVRDVSRSPEFDLLVGVIHGFRMQLFFFLGGFFGHLLWQRHGAREFLRQRSKRIGLPFLLGMVTLMPLTLVVWGWGNPQLAEEMAQQQNRRFTVLDIPTGHLWFLEMLLLLYVSAALVAWAARRLNLGGWLPQLDAAFDRFITSPWKPLLPVPPTVLCLWGGPMLGEIDNAGLRLLPAVRAVVYYGLFFGVGWWLHRRRHQLDALRDWLKSYGALAVVAFATLGVCHLAQAQPDAAHSLAVKGLGLTAASLYVWAMTFAVTGWFLRFAGQHRPWVRYLADASYWCYLTHLPLVVWLQVDVAQWPVNGWLKFALIMLVNAAVLLGSYHTCVRYTWLGRLLNGPRERPKTD